MKKLAFLMLVVFAALVLIQNGAAYSYDKMLKKPKDKICALCHADKDKFFSTSGHGKFNVTCQMCHNPHGQGNKSMLKWKEGDFCYQCHSKMKTDFDSTGHGMVDVACQQCHDPHGTADDASAPAAGAKPADAGKTAK
jgi:predicted CXXCH cytochrome family protein